MSLANEEIVKQQLADATDENVVDRLMATDSVYMSLTFENPDCES